MKDLLKKMFTKIGHGLKRFWGWIPFAKVKEKGAWKWLLGAGVVLLLLVWILVVILGQEPDRFDVRAVTAAHFQDQNRPPIGATTTATLMQVAKTLYDRPGGYISNDILPPTALMDDMANWEWGALIQVRDMTRSLRNDFSRSRSQSSEIPELSEAEPLFNIDNTSWIFPDCANKYQDGVGQLDIYLKRLSSPSQEGVQFYARADNLKDWLLQVEKRLGSLSQRLSSSVGQARINTDLAGEPSAQQSTATPQEYVNKTPWLQIDDVFYEARGTTWALLHLMQAVEVDFEGVLQDKNAKVLVEQIIREMEGAQRSVYSPMILNGGGFGVFANHSLVMTSYISRGHNAVIELRSLLSDG